LLSDPGAEDALYDSRALRGFAESIFHSNEEDLPLGAPDLSRAAAPDESIILTFRHLLEQHDLCGMILDAVNLYLDRKGIRLARDTIVEVAIIAAPSSTKNSKKERDPQMH
jgi:IS5 family transposase